MKLLDCEKDAPETMPRTCGGSLRPPAVHWPDSPAGGRGTLGWAPIACILAPGPDSPPAGDPPRIWEVHIQRGPPSGMRVTADEFPVVFAAPDSAGLEPAGFSEGFLVTNLSEDQTMAVPGSNLELLHREAPHPSHIILPGDHIVGVDGLTGSGPVGALLDDLGRGGTPGDHPAVLLVLRARDHIGRLRASLARLADTHVATFAEHLQNDGRLTTTGFEVWADSPRLFLRTP